MRISVAEAVRLGYIKREDLEAKPNKHGNVKTSLDEIRFDSKGEACRYAHLKHLERLGFISELRLQPCFVLQGGFTRNGKYYRPVTYTADFSYIENGRKVIEDYKGQLTKEFQRSKKMFLKIHKPEVFRISSKSGVVDI